MRHLRFGDHVLQQVDLALRTAFRVTTPLEQPAPAHQAADADMSQEERQLAMRLMRVNHTGEVCAQALYQGQALTARDPQVRENLLHAAREESDHLAWCAERVHALEGRTSMLNPAFYAASLALGAVAGLAGDRWSLGFIAETERQVSAHLSRHLGQLPAQDAKSRATVTQMKADEERHGANALAAGGRELPLPIKGLMTLASKVMTHTSYWV
jgi:3-demethoxyubiquinol 3-hydroxylase